LFGGCPHENLADEDAFFFLGMGLDVMVGQARAATGSTNATPKQQTKKQTNRN